MIKHSSIVRRGNRRGGVFIDAEDAIKWSGYAWLAYYTSVNSAKKACAMYKKCGKSVWRKLALDDLARARECRELCRALAAPRMIYREERP